MAWLGLLVLMLIVSASPAISIYLEHLRSLTSAGANDGDDPWLA